MRIGIDYQSVSGQRTGFGYYTSYLVHALRHLFPSHDYVLFSHPTKTRFRTPERILWDQVTVPWKAARAKVDLLHKPCFSAPLIPVCKTVLTIHDVIPLRFPQNFSSSAKLFWNHILPASCRRADRLVADSQATKRDLIELLGIPDRKIDVIYLGTGDPYLPRGEDEARSKMKPLKLPKRFYLAVGSLEPRKNISLLLRAFAAAAPHMEQSLVIVGKYGWGCDDVPSFITDHRLENRVHLLGYVEEEMIPLLYNLADALLFPSLYEGFGFPVVDAMASGCPVIAAAASSLPELSGDAALLLDPRDETAWTRAMMSLSRNSTEWEKMRTKGIEQAKKFRWEECARKTLAVYEEVL